MYIKRLFLLLLFVLSFAPVSANEEDLVYVTKHKTQYRVLDSLNTKVEHVVEIEVTDSLQAVSQVTILEPTEQINNLQKVQGVESEITSQGNRVNIKFAKALVGPGTYSIAYTFETNDIFKKTGTSYVLDIPQISSDPSIQEFELKVFLPQNLPAKYVDYSINSSSQGDYLLLTKDDLKSGESIVFAESMVYELGVKHLVDKNKDYIVIPPTIKGRQEVFIKSISKDPSTVQTDQDGNTLFYYKVSEPTTIDAVYTVLVNGNKVNSDKNFKDYTKNIKYWDYTKGVPANFLKFESEGIPENLVKTSMDFVVGYLDYTSSKTNYDYVSRVGAENLNESNKNDAVCLEYTDLYIALLRGLDIPARELSGLAYEGDIADYKVPNLHSWVDYNTNNIWSQADPTWFDTSNQDYLQSFDYNHIIFLIRGTSSEQPLLTGSYSSGSMSEMLRVQALQEYPEKQVITLPRIKLFGTNIIYNSSNNTVLGILPGKTGFKTDEDINSSFSDLYTVEFTEFSFSYLINPLLYFVLLSLLLAPFAFIFLHKRLNKNKKQVKSKVSSIG